MPGWATTNDTAYVGDSPRSDRRVRDDLAQPGHRQRQRTTAP